MLQQNNKHAKNLSIYKPEPQSTLHQVKSTSHGQPIHKQFNPQQLQCVKSHSFNHSQFMKKKHTEDEGFDFQQDQDSQLVIVKKQLQAQSVCPSSRKFIPYRIKQPKLKLTFVSKERNPEPLSQTIKRQYQMKSLQIKKSPMTSKSLIINPEQLISSCMVKIKRNFVGDNIMYHNFATEESKKIKFEIMSRGDKLVYELARQTTTYAQISLLKDRVIKSQGCKRKQQNSKIPRQNSTKEKQSGIDKNNKTMINLAIPSTSCSSKMQKDQIFFLDSQLNQLIKSKLKDSFVHHKKRQNPKHQQQEIQFQAEFQSANLEFVSRVNPNNIPNINQNGNEGALSQHNTTRDFKDNEQIVSQTQKPQQYYLYLRNDTNTHGHQNWFYFRVKNNSQQQKSVKLNIVNLKRNLNLIKEGQRIYIRAIFPSRSQWTMTEKNLQMKDHRLTHVYHCKVRTLSFQLDLQPQTQYEVSLLPPYTYSELLSDIQSIKSSKYAKIQTLTYSLIGLAIPIITFTNFQSQEVNKEVILISSRIHPGQTVASFMVKGFIQALSKDTPEVEQFLNSTIVKIIPMINPDGVVFGNFRTNYLGYDLNRSFFSDDEVTNPEIVALKQLGKKLRNIHGEKFHTFIDLHGHSSEKNIFTYGPDFQTGNEKFYKARLLPKLLDSKSPYFKYSSCSFKLQQYKVNTARAFFLNTIGIAGFTIQSSYAMYEPEPGKFQLLTSKEWLNFGNSLFETFALIQKLNKTHNIKNRTQLKKAISISQQENLKLLTTLKKQMKKEEAQMAKKVKKVKEKQENEDSDGQDQAEDLDAGQREQMEKKLVQNSTKNFVLPKVFKPTILYPTVTPKLFNIGDTNVGSYKILYTRRNRYQSIKIPTNTYLHSMQGMESMRPKARNIRVQRKPQF